MTIKLVIDMNLSPEWVEVLLSRGWQAAHWSNVGNSRAPDAQIMEWAARNECVVFTHDLDFGAALALTHASAPSVFQIRGKNVLPEDIADKVVATLHRYESELATGALVVFEENRARVRVLPF